MKPAYSLMLLLLIPSAVVGMDQNNNSTASPSSVRRVTRVVSRSDSQIPHGASSPLGTSPRSSSYSMMPGVLSRTSSSGVAAVARTSSSDFFLRNPEKKLQLVLEFLPTEKIETDFLCKLVHGLAANSDHYAAKGKQKKLKRSADKRLVLIRMMMQPENKFTDTSWTQRIVDICKENPLSTSARFGDLPPVHEMLSPRSRSNSIVRSRSNSTTDQAVDQK